MTASDTFLTSYSTATENSKVAPLFAGDPRSLGYSGCMWNSLLLAAASALLSLTPAWASPTVWDGLAANVQDSTIRFQQPPGRDAVAPLTLTPLKDLELINWLKPSVDAAPYLLIAANSSQIAEKSLFLVRADGKGKPQRVTFPGKLLDPKTREVVYESRVFYGRCLPGLEHDALVAYQRERMDRKHGLQSSLYVAEASPTMLAEKLIEKRPPQISTIQLRVKMRQCTEIVGKNRFFSPNFFNFKNRRGSEISNFDSDKDDGDEEDPKGRGPDPLQPETP